MDPAFTPILIDNAQEYVSRLAKAGALSKDPAFYRESAEQLLRLRAALRDPESGLWNHGRGWYTSAQTVTTTKWGRAQAWILRGLIESLSYIPPGSREYQQVAAVLTELAQSLLRYQDGQGFWHQVVDRLSSYQETSSTAFISYYFARAVHQGLLPEQPYRQVSATAFEALARDKISTDGVVYGTSEVTPPLATVEEYLRRSTPMNDPHGVATVLLSASGQLLIAREEGAPRVHECGAMNTLEERPALDTETGVRVQRKGCEDLL
jgi:rhamnogalacturonyl hydrolase YesR